MFERNVGGADRALRLVAGIVLLPLGLFGYDGVGGAAIGVVLSAVGLWVLATGAIGFCLLYVPLHISTAHKKVVVPSLQGGVR